MNIPSFPRWRWWLALGVLRAALFWIAAQFWFHPVLLLCPEVLALAYTSLSLPIVVLLILLALDTLFFGYAIRCVRLMIQAGHSRAA